MTRPLYSQETCIVCSEDFDLDRKMNSIVCGHVFCRECLESIDPRVCPVCREGYEEDDIECEGPWSSDEDDVPLDDDDDEDSPLEDEDDWVPSDEEIESDREAREELGLPRDQEEEAYQWNEEHTQPRDRDEEDEDGGCIVA